MSKDPQKFDYDQIPIGFYDEILKTKKGMRSFWHDQKFSRIIENFAGFNKSILDIGCFSGTFLSMIPENLFAEQVGVDILKKQIDFANQEYGTPFRKFMHVEDLKGLDVLEDNYFEYVTIIEVIEHLEKEEINNMISMAYKKLKPGGNLLLTTPNYSSLWPVLEIILNTVSDVKYEEQHITKFTYFNFLKKMNKIVDGFDDMFSVNFKSSSHFMTPYLSMLSYGVAKRLSNFVAHESWKFPFGSLIIVSLKKKKENKDTGKIRKISNNATVETGSLHMAK